MLVLQLNRTKHTIILKKKRIIVNSLSHLLSVPFFSLGYSCKFSGVLRFLHANCRSNDNHLNTLSYITLSLQSWAVVDQGTMTFPTTPWVVIYFCSDLFNRIHIKLLGSVQFWSQLLSVFIKSTLLPSRRLTLTKTLQSGISNKIIPYTWLSQTINVFRICGGVSNNNFICQCIADLLGRKVERMTDSDHVAARGVALLTGFSSGIWTKEKLRELVTVEDIFTPNYESRKGLLKTFQTWKKAVDRCLGFYHWFYNT